MAYLVGEGAALHLLESQRQHAVGNAWQPCAHDAIVCTPARTAFDELLGQEQGGRARGAVVVDVVDGDAGQPNLVQGALATRRVACLPL